jgi:hypothetical protein
MYVEAHRLICSCMIGSTTQLYKNVLIEDEINGMSVSTIITMPWAVAPDLL